MCDCAETCTVDSLWGADNSLSDTLIWTAPGPIRLLNLAVYRLAYVRCFQDSLCSSLDQCSGCHNRGLPQFLDYSVRCHTARSESSTSIRRYTGCPRRNGQNFGRVFLMLNYTDITQNTYIQSWTVTEIMAWENCGHLAFPRTVRLQLSRIDHDSAIKTVISVTARAPPKAIRQYFITARYSCAI